jgi:chemotaxis protein MotB
MSMSDRPILIKKIKKVSGGGHHGGAWKVAYADFVTAMMAFFLLMWLINTTDPEQKRGIAEYFAPASVSDRHLGFGRHSGRHRAGRRRLQGRGRACR